MATVVDGDFEWDSAKAAANFDRHGVSFEEAQSTFADPLAVYLDDGAVKEANEMTRATTQKTRPNGDDTELDLSRARVVGRGIHAQRGVHMTLRAVRTAAGKTQVDLSGRTGIAQGDVSRIEQRETLDELQVSTLRRYVEALGGKLELVAVFPKDHKIKLVGTEKERRR